MKIFTKFFFILVLGLQLNIYPQIPNAGELIPNGSFEDWIDENTPQDWLPNNIPTFWITVSRSSTAHTGSFAARLETVDYMGNPVFPYLQSIPFPVSQSYGSLMGYYQFQPVTSSEVLYIIAFFTENGAIVGGGAIDIGTAASSYMPFSLPIEYFRSAVVPDTAFIFVGISDTSGSNPPVTGASALIDELTFGPPVGVNPVSSSIPDNFSLMQNYPNPFNPSTKINFSIPEQSYIELTVYDILGNKITELISDTYSAGEYSVDFIADNLPAGVYLARFSAGKYSNTIKMTLLK